MPVLTRDGIDIDYTVAGDGPPVVLVHSSVSGNRQWRSLTAALEDAFRVYAINLLGYGDTTPWSGPARLSLADQARLIAALPLPAGEPVSLVGHSYGGSVALKAAMSPGVQVARMVLIEPNPFYLLPRHGRDVAYAEICALQEHVKQYGARGDWPRVAERFADYWSGAGAWGAMPENRRAAFAGALAANYHEWDSVMDETTGLAEIQALEAETLVISDPGTALPVREIVAILTTGCPDWTFHSTPGAGHMAPLTHPERIDPVVRRFLRAGQA